MEIRQVMPEEWRASREIRLRALANAPDAFCSTATGEREVMRPGVDQVRMRRAIA